MKCVNSSAAFPSGSRLLRTAKLYSAIVSSSDPTGTFILFANSLIVFPDQASPVSTARTASFCINRLRFLKPLKSINV